jgi:cell division protein FtsW
MMFIGRVSYKQLGKMLGTIALGLGLAGTALFATPNEMLDDIPGLHRAVTWKNRLAGFGGGVEVAPEDYDIDKNAQVAHANIAIATSHIIGKMPGNSVERDFLSQAFSDFIYAIIIEELGLIGGAFVALLYIILLLRTGRIAGQCDKKYLSLMIMGLALLIVTQAMVNMMVAVGLFPVTGQTLPLISRGGTATIINCVYFGMILSVSRYARRNRLEDAGKIELVPISKV